MNKFQGKIIGIESSDHISFIQIRVDSDVFSSIVLEGTKTPLSFHVQDQVTLLFKETEVGLAKGLQGAISLRNRFPAVVASIEEGKILTKVRLNYKGHWVESIISTASAKSMALMVNDQVEWLVKTNEVTLMKDDV